MTKALNDKKKYEADSFVIAEELNEARFELKNLEDRVIKLKWIIRFSNQHNQLNEISLF